MLKEIEITQLVPHPLNSYFFDDIEGNKWEEFLSSVQQNGVINPLVVTPSLVIISGHQRVKACTALGITKVKCYVCDFGNQDMEIMALIESNIRQRGVINSPSIKLGRILKELERIKSVDGRCRDGNNFPNGENTEMDNRCAFREKLGISKNTAYRSKTLASMPEECEEFIESGAITIRTATDVVAKLSPEEQVELFKSLDSTQRYTQQQIKESITAAFPKAERIDELERRLAEYQKSTDVTELQLREKLAEITQRERDTYETMMAERRSHRKAVADYEHRIEKLDELLEELGDDPEVNELRIQLQELEEERDDLIRDAKIAQNDADLLLIISAIKSVADALGEASAVTTPLFGELAVTAASQLDRLEDVIDRLRKRLSHGDGVDI